MSFMARHTIDLNRLGKWLDSNTLVDDDGNVWSRPLTDEILADLIVVAHLPHETTGVVFLKMRGRRVPADLAAAKAYVRRVAHRAWLNDIGRQRGHAFPFDPDDPAWNQSGVEPAIIFGWDGPLAREKLFVLVEIATAFLSGHHRCLIRGIVREWKKGPRQHRLSVADVHAQLDEPCDLSPHYCARLAFTNVGRIARGLAVAIGAVPPALRVPKKRKRARRSALEEIAPAAETTDTVF
jgi:hypothetical protein